MDYKAISDYKSDIMKDLRGLIAIPSVATEAKEGYPFGEKAAEALVYILDRAAEMGFKTKNIGNAAGYAELGEGEQYAAVLTHVDVVPAGEGWSTEPFSLTSTGGRLYGRGVADDKGAAVIALYCMKALADAGVTGKRRLRCIFGCGEEVGMGDMSAFFAEEPLPEFAFTPDSGYTVCNREKGILHLHISCPLPENSPILSVEGGEAINCVAEKVCAKIKCDLLTAERIEWTARRDGCECEIDSTLTDGGDMIFAFHAKGKSAHAMQPNAGVNSVAVLLRAMRAVLGEAVPKQLGMLSCDTDGSGLNIAQADEPSGALTMNLGNVRTVDGRLVFGIDIRYPVTANGDSIVAAISKNIVAAGMELLDSSDVPPIYMPEDTPLIKELCSCYEAVTGKQSVVYCTGGGTYARSLAGRGVAFGMELPGSLPTHLHEANESFGESDLMQHAEICLAAMHSLYAKL